MLPWRLCLLLGSLLVYWLEWQRGLMFTVRLRILWDVKQQKFMNEWIWWTDEKVELVFNRFMLPESLTSATSFKAEVVFIHSRCVFLWCLVVLNKIFSLFASLVCKKINSRVKDGLVRLPDEINSRDKIQHLGAKSAEWLHNGRNVVHSDWSFQETAVYLRNLPLFTVNRRVYGQIQMQKHALTHTGSANEGRKCVF